MIRKDYVKNILEDSIKNPPQGGVNQFFGKGLTPEEHDYLDKLIENYDWTKDKSEPYEH